MPVEATFVLFGLVVAALPLLAAIWILQRRNASLAAERLLLDERLINSQAAQQGLTADLEHQVAEVRALSQRNASQQAELDRKSVV